MTLASVVIAILALLFTVGSFWWIQARRGRLRSFPPQAFSGYLAVDGAALRLPLAIFNDGAAPIVVTDLRLLLRVAGGAEVPMHGNTFRKSLRPETDDVDDFAHPFAVPGRTVVARHVEFRSPVGPRALLSGHIADAAIEGLLDGEKDGLSSLHFPFTSRRWRMSANTSRTAMTRRSGRRGSSITPLHPS